MRSRNMLRGAFIALLLLGLTVATAAPPAAAQVPGGEDATRTNTQVSATPPSQPIRPLSTPAVIPVEITYTYQPQSQALLATQINLEVVDRPSWAIATISPETVFAPIQQGGTGTDSSRQSTVSTTLVVQTTADAPAFQQGNIRIQANAQQNQGLAASSGTTTVPIVADFFSILDAGIPQTVRIARPQESIDVPITITNLGNADTTVFINRQGENPQPGAGVLFTSPSPRTVPSKQQGSQDNTLDVPVSLQAPYQNGYINQPGVLNLQITSNYALDTQEQGMTTQVAMLITTKGFYVPGPGPAILIAALGALALALGKRKGLRD